MIDSVNSQLVFSVIFIIIVIHSGFVRALRLLLPAFPLCLIKIVPCALLPFQAPARHAASLMPARARFQMECS